MQSKKAKRIEHFLINVFVFALIGLLSLSFFNFHLFDPFTRAFKDLTLTDLYYSELLKKKVYNDNIIIVNIEHRSRYEIAEMIDSVQKYQPKVVGLDIIFSKKEDTGNVYLKAVFEKYDNYVFSYKGAFEPGETEVVSDPAMVAQKGGYVNLAGINKEHSTVRYFYPHYHEQAAFTTNIIKKYDGQLAKRFNPAKDKPCEIRYFGGDSSFSKFDYAAIVSGGLDSNTIKNHIVLFGYLGVENMTADRTKNLYTIDEDKLFTPLNGQLSGRSYPDMYGVTVHANILRMMLDDDYIKVIPAWLVWTLAFLLSWALVPVFCKWYNDRPMWFHPFTKFVQLFLSIVVVYISMLLYHYANIKLESAVLLAATVFLVDLILFYDAFVKFLKAKFHLNINSMFLEGHGHGH